MTRRQHASRALETLMISRAHLFGAVLNQVDLRRNKSLFTPATTVTRAAAITPHPRPDPRDARIAWILSAMAVWSLFTVGGVYVWAGVPLMIAALALAAVGRPRPRASQDARTLDRQLCVAVAATALQVVPLPAGDPARRPLVPCRRPSLSPRPRRIRRGPMAAVVDRPVGDALFARPRDQCPDCFLDRASRVCSRYDTPSRDCCGRVGPDRVSRRHRAARKCRSDTHLRALARRSARAFACRTILP